MAKCRICECSFEPFIDFGNQPIANGFRIPGDPTPEYFFSMKVGYCEGCEMVQLVDQPERERMFHEQYAFFSSTSSHMAAHFKRFSESLINDYFKGEEDPLYVEIGCNDGIMIQNFLAAGYRHLGVEPSSNVAEAAKQKGINTVSKFFDETLARQIKQELGRAKVIASANVMCHIPYLHSIAGGIKVLLDPKGVFTFEDPYLGDVIEKVSYDQIYDEHVFLFSARSVQKLFAMHDMELIKAEAQSTHGGSMRYTICHRGAYPAQSSVFETIEKERSIGLHLPQTYAMFRERVESSRDRLMELLKSIKSQGKRVVGYGATSKSATVANYCGIGPDLVEFICDTTPIKQGKVTPGMHIPVKRYEEFSNNFPEYALLFAWNHSKEIMAKESEFVRNGGKWILYVPEIKVI